MKTIYTYHFNNDGEFLCTVERNGTNFEVKKIQAIESLRLLDTIAFSQIKVFKHSIRLYKDNSEIQLRDLDLFVKNKLDQYIPKLYQKIEEALKEYLCKEAKKKQKKNKFLIKGNSQVKIFKATMGAVLMATLLSSMSVKAEKEPSIAKANLLEIENIENNEYFHTEENETNLDSTIEDNLREESSVQNQIITTTPIETNLTSIQNQENRVYLDYRKTNDLVKKECTFNEYQDLANWCGEKWGISSNLILMLLTQESVGKEENLMQIEWSMWAGKPIRVFNFRDHQYETFLLTNQPTEEEKAKYTCITEEDLKNPKTNISIGCVLLRKSAEAMNYHIMASLQCYNLGIGNMEKIFDKTREETGQTKEEVLSDQSNLSFYDYTSLPGEGDPNYLSNVFQFIDEYGDSISFKHLQNGEVVEEKIQVYSDQQTL